MRLTQTAIITFEADSGESERELIDHPIIAVALYYFRQNIMFMGAISYIVWRHKKRPFANWQMLMTIRRTLSIYVGKYEGLWYAFMERVMLIINYDPRDFVFKNNELIEFTTVIGMDRGSARQIANYLKKIDYEHMCLSADKNLCGVLWMTAILKKKGISDALVIEAIRELLD
jgi:hypothetical protein